jgi:iron complex transport system permease protein
MSKVRYHWVILILVIFLLGTVVFSLGVGSVYIPAERVIGVLFNINRPAVQSTDFTIVMDLRLPRVVLAVLVGAGLAVAGAAFQALFRNPLADPYVIGASGGASLGATLAISMSLTWSFAGLGPVQLAAFGGALLTVLLVYLIAGGGDKTYSMGLLLAGAAMSTMLLALVSLIMLINAKDMREIFSWLMGGFNGRSWSTVWSSGPLMVLGIAALWLLSRPLDAISCGDEIAQSIGLSLSRARVGIVTAASLVTAAAVSASGAIGFVGLVAPHIARLIFGATHRQLIPASALIGAILTLLADDLARTVIAPVELPVGTITSLVGGVFFLYMLKTHQRELRGN